jgi:hypothetical protein
MPIAEMVLHRLIFTFALKNHPIGAEIQLFNDGLRVDNGKMHEIAILFNYGTVSWKNKTKVGYNYEVYNEEISGIMDRLRYHV